MTTNVSGLAQGGADASILNWRRDPSVWVVGILALTMFLAPAVGATSERLLQDTLKSMIVAFGSLLAALLLCWGLARDTAPPRWHALLWLPLGLAVFAVGSMAWSHTYLAAVEAVRWLVLSLLLWVGLNSLKREHVPILINGIHWGAVMASLWAALQFWVDFKLFPQGPNPASTFINRNFFAEYVVCTLPFSVWLVTQGRGLAQIALRSFLTAFTVLAVMMTGTRSALLAMLILLVLLPWALYHYRQRLGLTQWATPTRWVAPAVFLLTLVILGLINSGNPKVLAEHPNATPLNRALARATSLVDATEYASGSFSIRAVMWKATVRLAAAHPLLGVGAGAWEVEIPHYQVAGSQVEDDYYAHNEYLQLLAEYGVVGWAFLLGLLAYLGSVAWRLRTAQTESEQAEAPMRAFALCSLLAFLLVSNAGFPWRMASSGALFALSLGILAASDTRIRERAGRLVSVGWWRASSARVLMVGLVVSLAVAVFLSLQAAQAERRLVHAAQLALSITGSGAPLDPRWAPTKETMLTLVDQGIAINPHYRKITPIVADELARWGDWENAVWIWESVVASRPHVVAILTNIGRGYAYMGHLDKAQEYLNRARVVQPDSLSARSLELMLLIRSGKEDQAADLIRHEFGIDRYDLDLLNTAYALGLRTKNWPMAIEALQRRNQRWPALALDGWIKLGHLYAGADVNDPAKALEAYQRAMALASPPLKQQVRDLAGPAYRDKL